MWWGKVVEKCVGNGYSERVVKVEIVVVFAVSSILHCIHKHVVLLCFGGLESACSLLLSKL
jgi:hypothetical protein